VIEELDGGRIALRVEERRVAEIVHHVHCGVVSTPQDVYNELDKLT
jgi:hypothetical protein